MIFHVCGMELVCTYSMPGRNTCAVAEHEREMISQRTKAALAAAKSRGTKLGHPAQPNP
jgi:hypothetical protein